MATSAVAAYFTANGFSDNEIVECHYEVKRDIDMKGRPSSVTQGGVITVEMASSADDAPLAEWITNSYKEADGTITFVDADKSTLKTVEFSKGRCISYAERFDKKPDPNYPDKPALTLTLRISAEKITFAGAEHDNNWDDKK